MKKYSWREQFNLKVQLPTATANKQLAKRQPSCDQGSMASPAFVLNWKWNKLKKNEKCFLEIWKKELELSKN